MAKNGSQKSIGLGSYDNPPESTKRISEACNMKIEFTQYKLPDGRKVPQWIDRPDDIFNKAEALKKVGALFEIEMLGDFSTISCSIEKEVNGEREILANFVCENGPKVSEEVDALITRAYEKEAALIERVLKGMG